MSSVTEGVRALHYVQDEIVRLSAHTHTLQGLAQRSCLKDMLRAVWGKEYRDGEFVFIKEHDGVEDLR